MPRILSTFLTLAAAVATTHAIQCTDLTLQITANVAGIQLPTNFNITGAEALNLAALNSLGKDVVGGTYNIAARFCEPTKDVESRRNTLQLLVHGVQQTKEYWSGLAPPGQGFESNDWIKWAAAEGYPTLAFDRICNGQSVRRSISKISCCLKKRADLCAALYRIIRMVLRPARPHSTLLCF